MQTLLQKYLHALLRVTRGPTRYGIAPHKPVLLLTLMEMIEKGIISGNRFYVDGNLAATFKENWKLLVNTGHTSDFTQPFYHLQNDKAGGQTFWFLQPRLGCRIDKPVKSFAGLREVTEFGYLADDLYLLVADPLSRMMIRQALLDHYFPKTREQYMQAKATGYGYVKELEEYILNEPKARLNHIESITEEDVFVRNALFKKNIARVYQSTCSFSGMRLESTYEHSLVDACHIVPFSLSQDCKVSNGIALCPNLHRAFDRGLIAIDSSYRIIVSGSIKEVESHPYSLKQLEGRMIRLPQGQRQYPAIENITWHRENVFKG